MNKKFSKRKNGLVKHRDGKAPVNDDEKFAQGLLREMIYKDEIFEFAMRKRTYDQIGIDWVVGRYFLVGQKKREFRILIQQKSSDRDANYFKKLNPCVPVWVTTRDILPKYAKIELLRAIIEELEFRQNPHVDFFYNKMKQLEGLT